MKIGIPTLGNSGLHEKVSPHFGRAPTFTIIDTKTGEVNAVPNTSEHGSGSGKPPEQLAKAGARVMLCSNLGPRAITMFEQNGVEVFVGAKNTVRETIDLWKAGKLQEATNKNACKRHRH
ncbi:dinitrogenase iron-molybdenum cofactor biosynthesis protein [candidate division MSBL1 archaeon SCGC-AAA261D19]|uniref:Dinitrogenase iron-molybdenum cofactor biosynthesis protein n=1 Tax=candidate division MSBL1 archaeon SCGC-AAA261D19 TaxID=1698273 RepID=A0A133V3W7_9EURY|nr:dinitrogenase iron-molybdenum cofactor biosynthesis protein [candidate division MSBL1 archaeon SCGC-AAA261D19]